MSLTCYVLSTSLDVPPRSAVMAHYRKTFNLGFVSLRPDELPKIRSVVRSDMVFDELHNACTASGVKDCAERDFLIYDASALGAIFAQLMHARYFRLRMDIVSNNALRKFHVDAVVARLIFTYRGTGTQNGIAADEADPRDIYTAQTGEPIIRYAALIVPN